MLRIQTGTSGWVPVSVVDATDVPQSGKLYTDVMCYLHKRAAGSAPGSPSTPRTQRPLTHQTQFMGTSETRHDPRDDALLCG